MGQGRGIKKGIEYGRSRTESDKFECERQGKHRRGRWCKGIHCRKYNMYVCLVCVCVGEWVGGCAPNGATKSVSP